MPRLQIGRSLEGGVVTGSNAEVVVGASPAPISAATSSVLAHSVVARPALFELLSAARSGGVTLVSAPAGSGKTVLLRSWIEEAGLADCAAWVSVERGERDAQRFWLAVIRELRAAVGADAFVVCPVYRLFVVLSDQICLDLSKALGRPTPTRPLTMISGFSGTSGHQTQSMEGVQGSRTLGRY